MFFFYINFLASFSYVFVLRSHFQMQQAAVILQTSSYKATVHYQLNTKQ